MDRHQIRELKNIELRFSAPVKSFDTLFDDCMTVSDLDQDLLVDIKKVDQSAVNSKQRQQAKLPDSGTGWLLKVIHDCLKERSKKGDVDLSDDEAAAKRSLFSSPLSEATIQGQHCAVSIGQLMSSIITFSGLEGFNRDPEFCELVRDFRDSLANHQINQEVGLPKSSTTLIDKVSVASPIMRPLKMEVLYHRSLSDQVFDLSHLQKIPNSIPDLEVKFINMNDVSKLSLFGNIGKLWLPVIFKFLSAPKLASKSAKLSSRIARPYKSKFIVEFKKSLQADLYMVTLDLNLYVDVSALYIALLHLYVKLLTIAELCREGSVRAYLAIEKRAVEEYAANFQASIIEEVS